MAQFRKLLFALKDFGVYGQIFCSALQFKIRSEPLIVKVEKVLKAEHVLKSADPAFQKTLFQVELKL